MRQFIPLIAIAVGVAPSFASAAPLPAPTYDISFNDPNNVEYKVPGFYNDGDLVGALSPAPAVSVSGLSSAGRMTASATMTYSFLVTGPTQSVFATIPTFITYLLQTRVEGSGSNQADAIFHLKDLAIPDSPDTTRDRRITVSSPACTQCTQMLTETFFYPIPFNDTADITLTASINIAQNGFASALADPYIFIDPVFLAQNPGYSIVVSEGVSNVQSDLPEPASMAILTLGIFGLGLARRGAT